MNKHVDASFQLEQQILDCWSITSQLDTLLEGLTEYDLNKDQMANSLRGLKELYNIKFDKAFRTFENVHKSVCEANKT